MQITKCDICHKIIKDKENSAFLRIRENFGFFEFCQKCSQPIINFLKSKKLLKKKK